MSFTDLVTRDHPPDRWRQLMALHVMGNHVDALWGSLVTDSVVAAMNRAIVEVEEAFERMTDEHLHARQHRLPPGGAIGGNAAPPIA